MRKRFTFVLLLGGLLAALAIAGERMHGHAAPQQAPAAAAEPQYDRALTDAARVLAGMMPADPARFANVTGLPIWQEYRRQMDAGWTGDVDSRYKTVSAWRDRELAGLPACRTLIYPFAGPDILNAYQFFPKCDGYVLFGLERLGSVPQLDRLSAADGEKLVTDLREALSDLFTRHYFITQTMMTELSGTYVNGTLPVMLVMLARLDARIVGVDRMILSEDGRLARPTAAPAASSAATPVAGAPATPAAASPVAAIRVTFLAPGSSRPQSVIYFRAQAENPALKRVVSEYLRHQAPALTMLKSASYLLHDDQFSSIRSVILDASSAILQDDSGMPFRILNKAGWQVTLYGRYTKPVPDFNYGFQPDLDSAYLKANPPELPFSFGYHWRDGHFGVMLAMRMTPPAAGKH
jgi:hypothetical protein